MRSFETAIRRLVAAPTELVVGPEPPPLPDGGGRFGWLRRYRTPVLWLAALAMFLLSTQLLLDQSNLWEIFIPVVAAVIALPLGLAADTPLRAWRLQVVVAVRPAWSCRRWGGRAHRGRPPWSSSPPT